MSQGRPQKPGAEAASSERAPDGIDQAIAATEQPSAPLSVMLEIALPGNRKSRLQLPLPLSQIDIYAIEHALHDFHGKQPPVNPARARLVLPSAPDHTSQANHTTE